MRGFVAGLLIGVGLVVVAFAVTTDDANQRQALLFASAIAIAAGFGMLLVEKGMHGTRSR